MDRPASVTFDTAPKPEIAASPVLALAAAYVQSGDVGPDFLPPKISPWRQFVATKLSTQKLAYAVGAAAVLVVIVGGLFGWQQIQLVHLESSMGRHQGPGHRVAGRLATTSRNTARGSTNPFPL